MIITWRHSYDMIMTLRFSDSRHSRSPEEPPELWSPCPWAAGCARQWAGPPSSISSEHSAWPGSWSGASRSTMVRRFIPGYHRRRNSSFRSANLLLIKNWKLKMKLRYIHIFQSQLSQTEKPRKIPWLRHDTLEILQQQIEGNFPCF